MRPAAPRLKIKTQLICGDEIAMGPGKAELLSWVDRAGSISGAAKGMGLSYRRAWLMVDLMNRCFAAPLVTTAHGGAHGGGARLTPEGHAALSAFRNIEAAAQRAADEAGESLRALLTP